MSSALAIDAAGRIRVVAVERLDRPHPAVDRACGAATLPPAAAAEWRTLLPVIPTFARMRELTKSSHGLTADRFDHLAGDEIQHVVVGVGAAEAGRRRNEAQPPRDLLAVVGRRRPPEQVAGAEAEAAAVHQQVANRQLAGDEGIPHLEPGQVADDRRIPLDLALLDQQPERGRGEQLRVRRDAEQRPRIHRRRFAELAHAVALRHNHAAVLDDAERDAGDLERLHHAGDVGIEIRQSIGGCLRAKRCRGNNQDSEENSRKVQVTSSAHGCLKHVRTLARKGNAEC